MNAPATSRRPTSRPAARIAALLIPLGIAATPLPSFADLPTLEDPSRGTGSGIMQTLQNYGYDIVLLIAGATGVVCSTSADFVNTVTKV